LILADTTIRFLGEALSLLAAVNWAFALILFKLSGETVPPLSLCLFKNVVGVVCLAVALLFVGVDGASLAGMDVRDVCLLAVSGVLGIAVADTLLFHSLNTVGVGLVTIVECSYTPSIVLFAWLLLSEQLELHDYIGGALVLSAVFLVSGHKPPANRTRMQLVLGLLCGAVAIAMMAFGIVLVKPIIEDAPLLPVTLIRLLAGTVVMAAPMAASKNRRAWFRVFRPSAVWKTCMPASFFGSFLAMIFWVGGYKYTSASIAAILNQTSTIMALFFAWVILKEPLTRRKLLAALLAISGIITVTLGAEISRRLEPAYEAIASAYSLTQ